MFMTISLWPVLGMLLGVAAACYLLGCFNGAVIVSKYILRDDVRSHGSGNAGLTNFYRTFGGPLTAVVILCDVLKAVAAVLLGSWLLGFKGGKGILSGGTIALMIDWRVALVVWGGFLILTALTRYVSLGSLWAGASFPFISWYCYPNPAIVALAFACGGLVVWQHRGNIRRLLSGTENKFSLHRKHS